MTACIATRAALRAGSGWVARSGDRQPASPIVRAKLADRKLCLTSPSVCAHRSADNPQDRFQFPTRTVPDSSPIFFVSLCPRVKNLSRVKKEMAMSSDSKD